MMKGLARVKRLQDGKRASRYFCNLEKRNYTSRSMSFIETRDGQTVFSQKEMLDKTKASYENLYSQKETVDVDLRTLLSNAPSLTHEEREMIKGQITYTQALAAVQAMKNNKSPGPDGYTPQFYKYFLETQEIFLFAQSIMDIKMKKCQ